MRAWLYTSASGGLERAMKLTSDAPQPPRPLPKGQVLVRVHRMSLNPADYKFPEALGPLARAVVGTPAAPGMDFAGVVVEAAGDSGTDGFDVGQKVFGRVFKTRFGPLGEYVLAGREQLAALPDEGVSLDEAACVGTAGLTAYQSIAPHVRAGRGDEVFVNGGSGGTGTFGIQVAKALGCRVTASCSARNADLCRSLGADEVVDYTSEDVCAALRARGKVFKLVVDNVGHSPADLHKAADDFLVPAAEGGGRYVQVGAGASLGDVATLAKRSLLPSLLGGGKSAFEFMFTKESHEDLAQLGRWMQEGKVKAVIDEVFEFADAPKAIEKLKSGRAKGKIVVKVSED
ncbi:hypothetical protein GGR56DRAFT_663204 [Xylariaceae sp. FL0804]|nr:hypothetical protein GGR56DRAFT_663204 [Xylariaceae sp. FL0804]